MLDSALIKAENGGYSKGSGKSPGQNQFASRVEVGACTLIRCGFRRSFPRCADQSQPRSLRTFPVRRKEVSCE